MLAIASLLSSLRTNLCSPHPFIVIIHSMMLLFDVLIGQDTPLGKGSLSETFPSVSVLVNIILNNSLTIIGILLLILLIIGGIQFIMSAGSDDPKKAAAAKTMITDAIIGFAVVLCAFFFIQIVEVITGLKIISPGF